MACRAASTAAPAARGRTEVPEQSDVVVRPFSQAMSTHPGLAPSVSLILPSSIDAPHPPAWTELTSPLPPPPLLVPLPQIIGSGIGGLCCAAIAARYGFSVTLLESHTIAGGCAHSFERGGYEFDSGPSFFADIGSESSSNNALKQVLDLVGESVDCAEYTGWTAHLPEGVFKCENNEAAYLREIERFGGASAVEEWRALSEVMAPLARSTEAMSFASLRNDLFAAFTVGRNGPAFAQSGIFNGGPFDAMATLNGPFSYLLDKANVKNTFLRNLIDLECFVLSGMRAEATLSPEMAYMYQERHKENSKLDYPMGGTRTIIDALVRGIERYGGRVILGAHVEEITFDGAGKASGVKLSSGQTIRATKKVVSNASVWDTYMKLVPDKHLTPGAAKVASSVPNLDSFIHLHLGIDGENLGDLGIHHLVVNDWEGGVDAEQNVINISIPTMLDPSLAPPGKHVVHAYTAANEPYGIWENLKRGSKEYNGRLAHSLAHSLTHSLSQSLELSSAPLLESYPLSSLADGLRLLSSPRVLSSLFLRSNERGALPGGVESP